MTKNMFAYHYTHFQKQYVDHYMLLDLHINKKKNVG